MLLGDPNKYGSLKQSNLSFNVPSKLINIDAPFQKKIFTITLPLTPSLQITPIKVEEKVVVEKIIDKNLQILNFIDVNKLVEGRAGGKVKTYSLKELIALSTLLNLEKSQSKKVNIENIKKHLYKIFGDQPNL